MTPLLTYTDLTLNKKKGVSRLVTGFCVPSLISRKSGYSVSRLVTGFCVPDPISHTVSTLQGIGVKEIRMLKKGL